MLCRCVVTFALAVWGGQRVAAFAGGHLAYALVVLAAYVAHFAATPSLPALGAMLPSRSLAVEPAVRSLAVGFVGQAVWKLLLAEGEKVVMVALGPRLRFTAADQGVYAVVSNLGSLVARFAFQPIEEAAYAVFGKLHSAAEQQVGMPLLPSVLLLRRRSGEARAKVLLPTLILTPTVTAAKWRRVCEGPAAPAVCGLTPASMLDAGRARPPR